MCIGELVLPDVCWKVSKRVESFSEICHIHMTLQLILPIMSVLLTSCASDSESSAVVG